MVLGMNGVRRLCVCCGEFCGGGDVVFFYLVCG